MDPSIAIWISLAALLVAIASFVWNVWQKFIYPKARVRVSFTVQVLIQGDYVSGNFLKLGATNFGPTETTLTCALIKLPRNKDGYTIGLLNPLTALPPAEPATSGPFGGGLPKKLQVGEEFSVFFVFDHEGLRNPKIKKIGFQDTFGRNHWAHRRTARETLAKIRAGAPQAPQNKVRD